MILDLDDVVKTNHISCRTKGLSLIQFESLEAFVLHEHRLPNSVTQERSFPVNVFDKLAVNITSCFEVEEESDKEDGRHENSLGEIDKTLAALEAILVHLNWGQIINLPDDIRQHMVGTLKHPNVITDKVSRASLRENGVLSVSKMTKAPFPSVTTSSKGLLQEESNLPTVHASDEFDPDTYKLMKESGYDFSKQPSPRHVINTKPYGPNDAQKMVQK